MFHHCNDARTDRRGLTFVELIVSMSLMIVLVGMLDTLASAVHAAYEYNEGQSLAIQNARVILDRITRTASQAMANEQFPGFIVLSTQVGSWQYPDTLVIWHPTGTAVYPTGLPQYNELVIYCPSPSNPNHLLEVTAPGNTGVAPPVSNATSWATQIAAIVASKTSTTVVLTSFLRSCPVATGSSTWRGDVRFVTRLLPSASQWSQYQAGTLTWTQLSWAQGIRGSQTALRQVWLRMEVELMPGPGILGQQAATEVAVPFLGSAALYYEMHR